MRIKASSCASAALARAFASSISKDQAHRVWEQLDENGNGKVSYSEFASWAKDRLADVAVDDINITTRSNVNVGQIREKAASKIGA